MHPLTCICPNMYLVLPQPSSASLIPPTPSERANQGKDCAVLRWNAGLYLDVSRWFAVQKNHLSGLKRRLLKLVFWNETHMAEVRRECQALVRRNRYKAGSGTAAYDVAAGERGTRERIQASSTIYQSTRTSKTFVHTWPRRLCGLRVQREAQQACQRKPSSGCRRDVLALPVALQPVQPHLHLTLYWAGHGQVKYMLMFAILMSPCLKLHGPLQDALDSVEDMREHDVPQHWRWAIDNDVRAGYWYTVTAQASCGRSVPAAAGLQST